MWESFKAFNINAISNFLYILSTNYWFSLLLIGVVGTILLFLKEEIDTSTRGEQNVL